MPSTQIWNAAMTQIGEQLADLKEGQREQTRAIREVDARLTEHLIANGPAITELRKDINGVGARLNEHVEAHAKWRPLWIGVIVAAAGAASKAVLDLFRKTT